MPPGDDDTAVDHQTRDIDLVFASNIDDPSSDCHRDSKEGCDLWMARLTLNLTFNSITVEDMEIVHANENFGEWHPKIYVSDKANNEYVVYYTKFVDIDEEDDNNSIGAFTADGDTWSVTNLTFPGSKAFLPKSSFAEIDADGDYLTFTTYTRDEQENLLKNIRRKTLESNSSFGNGTSLVFSDDSTLCEDKASDGHFLWDQQEYIVYHCPLHGTYDAAMVEYESSTMYDRRSNDVANNCAHFTVTRDNEWAVCSAGGDIKAYDITIDGGDYELNDDNSTVDLISRASGWYETYMDLPDCSTNDIRQLYASYGDASEWLLYTVLCDDDVDVSKLYFANVDPEYPPTDGDISTSDLINLSVKLEEYLSDNLADYGYSEETYTEAVIAGLQFCSGDFDLATL